MPGVSAQVVPPGADGPVVPHLVSDRAALRRVRAWVAGTLLIAGGYGGLLAGRYPAAYPWPLAVTVVLVLTVAVAVELAPSPVGPLPQAYWTQRSGWVKP